MKRSIIAGLLGFLLLFSQSHVFAAANYSYRAGTGHSTFNNSPRPPMAPAPIVTTRPTSAPRTTAAPRPVRVSRPAVMRPSPVIIVKPPVRPVIRYTPPRTNIIYVGNTRPYYPPGYYTNYYNPYYPIYPTTTTTQTVIISQPAMVAAPSIQPAVTINETTVEQVEETVPVGFVQQQEYIQPAYSETITTTVVTDNRDKADKILDRTGKAVGIVGVASLIGLGIAALVRAL